MRAKLAYFPPESNGYLVVTFALAEPEDQGVAALLSSRSELREGRTP